MPNLNLSIDFISLISGYMFDSFFPPNRYVFILKPGDKVYMSVNIYS